MDNPQYYQPLSHALNPPRSSSQPQFYKTASVEHQKTLESDDDDEGRVEEQLSRTSAPPSPKPPETAPENQHEPEPKRRGRPRGSKNRRGRVSSQTVVVKSSPPSHQPLHATGQGTNPPQLPEVTAQNQQYYEFQWRVLNLCAEFYGAAEELVKGTPALVIAQCYQMGPNSKVDPLIMLNEAKQNCDILLANPSHLITSPPPPMYPSVPTFYATGVPSSSSSSGAPTGPPTMISQPQTFVVPMGSHAYYAPPPPGQYPTTSYYSYPYGHPGAYYTPAVAPVAPPPAAPAAPTPIVTMTNSGTGNSGSWSDEEIERLKIMAEEKKTGSGEIDWDDIISQWGSTRSRHQILIKATQLGLKESSSVRGVKRRRDVDGDPISSAAPTPNATTVRNPSSTPSSTPVASPSLQNQPQPASSNSKASTSVPVPPPGLASQPWPMPVVAVSTSSPVNIGPSPSDHRVTSYYRPRPTDPPSRPSSSSGASQLPTVHRYMYQPNGHHSESAK
ncbi:hypothetical protein C8R41DRAFT_512761 [Lentinula lateritia]|uniref:Myb-like domain-containing protein n=1 Tax=Lentinula lateritia TaxID=40482 RepID=A0ABQ8V7J3_9AGAR|nr:hypothetical protein C8R41DRAFT_512761 [Lentinula lateritia]